MHHFLGGGAWRGTGQGIGPKGSTAQPSQVDESSAKRPGIGFTGRTLTSVSGLKKRKTEGVFQMELSGEDISCMASDGGLRRSRRGSVDRSAARRIRKCPPHPGRREESLASAGKKSGLTGGQPNFQSPSPQWSWFHLL